jgi:hypothetical protein
MTNMPLARSPGRLRSPGVASVAAGVSSEPMASVACSQGLPACVARVFQAPGQVVRLGSRDHRVPDHVGAGGEALQAILDAGGDLGVIGLEFVAGVDQHQRATIRRRQEGLQAFKAVLAGHGNLPARLELGDVGRERLAVGGVHLEQLELVARLGPQQALHHERRARIDLEAPIRVEPGNEIQVVFQRRRFGIRSRCRSCGAGFWEISVRVPRSRAANWP